MKEKRVRRLLWVCLILLIPLVALLVAGGVLLYELRQPYRSATAEEETFVFIPPGAGAKNAAELLRASGVLHTRLPFTLWLRYCKTDRNIQSGEYRFADAATPMQVAERLIRGDIYYRSITVPEGLTAEETVELLAQNGFGDLGKLRELLAHTDWIQDLAPGAENLEGYLFPETYRFGRRDDEEAVLRAMIRQFRNRMDGILKETPLPEGWTATRVVTLASLIEKEVKTPEERATVSSVLVNRLRRKMPLGCDATIIYAMKLAGTWNGNIRKSDLRTPSPYNSYLRRDLPPGPICNPGAESLRAALNPTKTDFLYYVSKNDGTHQFSRDLRSHNNAVNHYQRSGRPR
jgi:UPF0755 protein